MTDQWQTKLMTNDQICLYDNGDLLTLDALVGEDNDSATHHLALDEVLELRDSLNEWVTMYFQRNHPIHSVETHSANFPCEICKIAEVAIRCTTHDVYLCGTCDCDRS